MIKPESEMEYYRQRCVKLWTALADEKVYEGAVRSTSSFKVLVCPDVAIDECHCPACSFCFGVCACCPVDWPGEKDGEEIRRPCIGHLCEGILEGGTGLYGQWAINFVRGNYKRCAEIAAKIAVLPWTYKEPRRGYCGLGGRVEE
jgi:hypothetical protein